MRKENDEMAKPAVHLGRSGRASERISVIEKRQEKFGHEKRGPANQEFVRGVLGHCLYSRGSTKEMFTPDYTQKMAWICNWGRPLSYGAVWGVLE